MSENKLNQIQPFNTSNVEEFKRITTNANYRIALHKIEEIIKVNAECRGMGPELFTEGDKSEDIARNKEAIVICGKCVVSELCELWATAENLTGVIAGGVRTKVRMSNRRKDSATNRSSEINPAKARLMKHATDNKQYYIGLIASRNTNNIGK